MYSIRCKWAARYAKLYFLGFFLLLFLCWCFMNMACTLLSAFLWIGCWCLIMNKACVCTMFGQGDDDTGAKGLALLLQQLHVGRAMGLEREREREREREK